MSEISNRLDEAEAAINTANLNEEAPTYIKAFFSHYWGTSLSQQEIQLKVGGNTERLGG